MRTTGIVMLFVGESAVGKTTVLKNLFENGQFLWPLHKEKVAIHRGEGLGNEVFQKTLNGPQLVDISDFLKLPDDAVRVEKVTAELQYERHGQRVGINPPDDTNSFDDMLEGANWGGVVSNVSVIKEFKRRFGDNCKVVYVEATKAFKEKEFAARREASIKAGVNPDAFDAEYRLREQEAGVMRQEYIENMRLFDGVILNVGTRGNLNMQALHLLYKFTKNDFDIAPLRPKKAPVIVLIGAKDSGKHELARVSVQRDLVVDSVGASHDRMCRVQEEGMPQILISGFDKIEDLKRKFGKSLMTVYVQKNDVAEDILFKYYAGYGIRDVDYGILNTDVDNSTQKLEGMIKAYRNRQTLVKGIYDEEFKRRHGGVTAAAQMLEQLVGGPRMTLKEYAAAKVMKGKNI